MLRIKKKTQPMEVVVPWDPAIDTKKSDLKKYLETLEMKYLKFKSGKEPSVIHITSLSRWVMSKLVKLDVNDVNSYNLGAFRHGIERIVNLQDHLLSIDCEIDGETGSWIPQEVTEGPNGSMIPTSTEEDAILFFNSEFRNFIASVVAARSNLRRGKSSPYARQLSSFLRTYVDKE